MRRRRDDIRSYCRRGSLARLSWRRRALLTGQFSARWFNVSPADCYTSLNHDWKQTHGLAQRMNGNRPAVGFIYATSVCRSRLTSSPRRHRYILEIVQVQDYKYHNSCCWCCPNYRQVAHDSLHAGRVLKRERIGPIDLWDRFTQPCLFEPRKGSQALRTLFLLLSDLRKFPKALSVRNHCN